MTFDLAFLDESVSPRRSRPRPVNVYDILREGWRETRVDMTLQFFLDPSERHGLGSLVIDALLRVLDGAPSVTPTGADGVSFSAEDALGSDAWEIGTQIDFIDVYATNPELGIAVVLENKIGHVLNNPLSTYARRARQDGFGTILIAVLAPDVRSHHDIEQQSYVSKALTYLELSDEIKRDASLIETLLSPRDLDQRRSLDLLQQFIEARSGASAMTDLSNDAQRFDEMRGILDRHAAAIEAFENARRSVVRMIKDRLKRLEPLIADRLSAAGLETDWEAHGGSREEGWSAYHFVSVDWSVELKVSVSPSRPAIFVYDRRGRSYQDSTIEPLDVPWASADEVIVDAFVERVGRILERVRAEQH